MKSEKEIHVRGLEESEILKLKENAIQSGFKSLNSYLVYKLRLLSNDQEIMNHQLIWQEMSTQFTKVIEENTQVLKLILEGDELDEEDSN